jgi:hypothetical protein
MSEYTPTTRDVRQYWVREWAPSPELEAQFDRWLAEVERAAAEKAWEAGHEAFEEAWRSDHLFPYDYATENPYRTGGAE